ncbi:hypothetical protein SAMN06297251_10631 [Fulvimarina manganoxydans]|uniref:Uncharacterized protein n=2 Tax=Fulvimarina manganoxydans TaxID=937218 RepID=A0A1W2BC64_9HYPH|nr:hypothetical protein SAMN06297251_10631 [Fulvimarina manganoxydans]
MPESENDRLFREQVDQQQEEAMSRHAETMAIMARSRLRQGKSISPKLAAHLPAAKQNENQE